MRQSRWPFSLRPDRPPAAWGLLAAIAAVALTTVAIYPLSTVVPVTATGVVYLLGVLIVSVYWGLALGLVTSVLSAAAFNFFHLQPTGGFAISHSGDWVALMVFFVSAVIASAVAEVARVHSSEAELRRREAELKTALLNAVSHDLRSPLTAIAAAGAALESSTLSDTDRRQLANTVVDESARLSNLVGRLLDLSRLQAAAAEPNYDWCSIDEVLRETITQIDPGHTAVVTHVDGELPLIRADAAQLERVFANLLDNALRYRGDRPVEVDVTANTDAIEIVVADHGPGINETDRERVFEPFFQAEINRRSGSGLGLAVVKGFVEANGGTVSAHSGDGDGSRFIVRLPVVAAAESRNGKEPSGGGV